MATEIAPGITQNSYYNAKKLYGFGTREEYIDFVMANPVCRACGDPDDLHIDHCHASGRVRGRLCGTCNVALGMLGESVERALALIEYMKEECDE